MEHIGTITDVAKVESGYSFLKETRKGTKATGLGTGYHTRTFWEEDVKVTLRAVMGCDQKYGESSIFKRVS